MRVVSNWRNKKLLFSHAHIANKSLRFASVLFAVKVWWNYIVFLLYAVAQSLQQVKIFPANMMQFIPFGRHQNCIHTCGEPKNQRERKRERIK